MMTKKRNPKKPSEAPKKPTRKGRPTAYKASHCVRVLKLGREGASLTQMALSLGVHRATMYRWIAAHPEFCDAVTRAHEASQAWWERQGREGLWAGPAFNARTYIFMMRNMFPQDYGHRK
jgi:hypothetical protein